MAPDANDQGVSVWIQSGIAIDTTRRYCHIESFIVVRWMRANNGTLVAFCK